MSKYTRKSEQALRAEHTKQLDIIYSACFCVLWQDYQWKEKRIIRRFQESAKIWTSCKNFSILEVMENETGIEMTLEGDKSFHEYAFLSGDTMVKPISDAEYIYMQQRCVKWLPTLILASVCLALYRIDGWGYERLSRFICKVDALRQLLGKNPKDYDRYMLETTGHHTIEFWRQ